MYKTQWHSLLRQALALLGHYCVLALEPQHGLPQPVVVGLQGHQLGLPLHPAALQGATLLVFAGDFSGQVVDGRLQGPCRVRAAVRLNAQALTYAGSPQLQIRLSVVASATIMRRLKSNSKELVLPEMAKQGWQKSAMSCQLAGLRARPLY